MMEMGRIDTSALLVCLLLLLGGGYLPAQSESKMPESRRPDLKHSDPKKAAGGIIYGVVKSGNMPIPGAGVLVSSAPSSSLEPTAQKLSTWTDVDGGYTVAVPSYGSYTVQVQMAAFAKETQQVVLDASHPSAQAKFDLMLLSRTREAAPQPRKTPGQGGGQRGFQSLALMQGMADQGSSGNAANDVVPPGMPVPGIAPDSATESIAVSGNTSNPFNSMSGDELQQRSNDARQQGGGFGALGGFGGLGGGGFGGGGGRGGAMMITGRRGFDINHPHGSIYYGIGDYALNAAPFALDGEPPTNPAYQQNSFGGSLGGPLNIPNIYHGGAKTFFFVNYNGKRGENPFDQFSVVPTLLEREGNFSQARYTSGAAAGSLVMIFNPATGAHFPNNTITQINPIAAGLLSYIPLPNLTPSPGNYQNFQYVTSANNNTDDLNVRVNHTLGSASAGLRRRRGPRNNLTFGFHYHATGSTITNAFPSVGGNTSVRSFDIPVGYVRTIGKLTNSLRFDFNRSRTSTLNLYAYNNDITGGLGVAGVSTNPFDWGLPNLSFMNSASLQDTAPRLLRNQTYTISNYDVWIHGKHSWRWGGDFRRVEPNTETVSNGRGTFVFSGINTSVIAANGNPVAGTGYDFADFLLGLPQQTSVDYGYDNYHFRGNYWDLYAQDEWKMRANLTLNLGVRYEYVSPVSEENNLIANLDLSPGVLNAALGTPSIAVVLPGQVGPYSGKLPATLVRPDRKGFAPRLGFAWKPLSKTVVRGGYGINYNTGAYQAIAQQLAFQPPFSTAETNIQTAPGALTLQSGFPAPSSSEITNSYAINPNYRFGYVQIRNLDIQHQIRPTLLLNIDYTGTKGTNLDVLEAPNRTITPTGIAIRIPAVQAFTYENSLADSEANAGSVRLRKRLAKGFSAGGLYTFSKSIDDASSIGGGATSAASAPGLGAGGTGAAGATAAASAGSGANTVAQNPFDVAAERGLSSFNQTHRFTGDYLWELPFGHDRRWLTGNNPLRAIFGDWLWTGDWTIASGLPCTPHYVNSANELNGGTDNTLRPNLVRGEPIQISDPSLGGWFNTLAFAAPPPGQYGNARRNSIIGPPTHVFDMAITKVIPVKESRTLELRAQATNVFNIPNYTSIDTSVTSPTFGRVTAVGAMRQITMTARFRF